jgi:secernin
MGSDMFVALGQATVDGHTYFAQNSGQPAGQSQALCLTPRRQFTPGEKLRTQHLEIDQAREVHAVLGSRARGMWGYTHGMNSRGVAAGCLALPAALSASRPGLLGSDLVRLMLERSSSARQAVDLLIDLVKQHGHGCYPGCSPELAHDSGLLIADPVEAYAVETAGAHWVYQEIKEVRAVSNVRVVHQDWDRISCGLASYAIERGWWPEDGSKLDFAAVLSREDTRQAASMRRWGRGTLLLQEQNGHIDGALFRRLLCDHAEGSSATVPFLKHTANTESICSHPRGPASTTVASMIAELSPEPTHVAHAWCAFGVPCASVFFPVFLDGELPEAFVQDQMEVLGAGFGGRLIKLVEQRNEAPDRLARVREAFSRLQAFFDQETRDFLAEGALLKKQGTPAELQRHASMFMQYNLEKFEEAYTEALRPRSRVAVEI